MKRSTARWTTAFAAAAWLAVPAAGWSQTPPATTPPSSPTPAQQPAAAHQQHGSAQEHIRQAKAALNDIPATSIPARSKARFTELKRHVGALEKFSGSSTADTKTTARSKSNWATEVAAIDKILTELLGPATTSGTGEPTGATGTAGTTGTTKSRSATTLTLDEAAKAKLMEVRTAVTQFAAAMSGTGAPAPSSTPSEPATDPAASAATTTTQAPSATGTTPAQEAQQPAPATAQVDPEIAKRHLTAARDTLSQLTQLPAAAQLTGDARTQVSQLITNFNELITTNADWKASFDKVNNNVTALLGAETSAAAQTPAPQPQPPATGTPGAVGTTGTATTGLDPAVRAKLLEFRNHLMEFEKASGAASTASSTPSAASTPTASSTPGSPEPSAPAPTTTPSTTASPTTSAPSSAPMPEQSAAPAQTTAPAQRPAATGQDNAARHIDAIEAILNGRSAPSTGSTTAPTTGTPTGNPPSATAGTTGAGAASVTLDRAQLEQLRMHLTELRKAVEKK